MQEFGAEKPYALRAVLENGLKHRKLVLDVAERWMALPSSVTDGSQRISRSFSSSEALFFSSWPYLEEGLGPWG